MERKGYVHIVVSLTLALTMLAPCAVSAQTAGQSGKEKRDVRRGNRDYGKGNYKEAEIDYRKALVKDSTSVAANFNLAADLYRQGDTQGAVKYMQKVEQSAVEAGYGADWYYNLGDMALASKDYKTAVDAFAKSLLLRPDDLDAKENYIYARKMLENQQQNGGGQNEDNQDQNKDRNQDGRDNQNQDNQNQDKQDQDNKDNQQDKNRNDDKNNGDKQQDNQDNGRDGDNERDGQQNPPQDSRDGQGQPQKISPQAAQQMLQAIQAKEKETQDKVNKEKAAALKGRQKDKNW